MVSQKDVEEQKSMLFIMNNVKSAKKGFSYLRILKSKIGFQVLKKKRISTTQGLYNL